MHCTGQQMYNAFNKNQIKESRSEINLTPIAIFQIKKDQQVLNPKGNDLSKY